MTDVIIILGSPASGKTTLARRLAADLGLPCLCKDDVKEALFDILGGADRPASRRLSDASFAALLRLAQTQLGAGLSCLIEGNWRMEHAVGLAALATQTRARSAQVWCRAKPLEIERRFRSRRRHPAHLDAIIPNAVIRAASAQPPSFLNLAGPRWIYDSDADGDSEAGIDSHVAGNSDNTYAFDKAAAVASDAAVNGDSNAAIDSVSGVARDAAVHEATGGPYPRLLRDLQSWRL